MEKRNEDLEEDFYNEDNDGSLVAQPPTTVASKLSSVDDVPPKVAKPLVFSPAKVPTAASSSGQTPAGSSLCPVKPLPRRASPGEFQPLPHIHLKTVSM